jgi:hypothetical protein
MSKALATEEWRQLNDKLLTYVENFEFKVVRASGGFQM